uniref:Expansin n=1 Tax=Leersia perrieri TaxID=77586 RepID=A0A0D9XK16_9ORYZ
MKMPKYLAAFAIAVDVVALLAAPAPAAGWSSGSATTAALSTALFNNGASCGQCYQIACDTGANTPYCRAPGATVTITATNLCPPNPSLPSNDGGWCNPPRAHFDMAQPAWEAIGLYQGGIIPVLYQRVPCARMGGVRFTVRGFNYFELVLISNVGGSGSVASAWVKGTVTDRAPMSRNWGANWQSFAGLAGQALTFGVTSTEMGHIPATMSARYLVVLALCVTSATAGDWIAGTATFYGGKDASGTMGGACGYGNLYTQGYGVYNAALSSVLFNDGASCGQCYLIMCDSSKTPEWCKAGTAVTITATNLCPPNWALPNNNGGWCNPPRPHFDMAQPAWETIGIYRAGIVPILFQQVKCWKQGGVRFTILGFNYFELFLVTNVAGSGSIKSMSVKGTNTGWITLTRNWGANWQCNSALVGQALSFQVTSTGGQTLYIDNAVPDWWKFGTTFTSNQQFDH